ncbi:MAG: Holliday junction resolvase RuvX [Xanthomonadales bacterium]|jgi:putative Holliday junction resolvase|nr:Holliday junction resolvase RuvX [Xanthomonadales bacterium]
MEIITLLAFDVGTRDIGVAVGSRLSGARPLQTFPAGSPDATWQQLLREWKPALCIVGLPLNEDGSEQPMVGTARAFANRLRRLGSEVVFADERLSTREARARFRDGRRAGNQRRADIERLDAMAAAVILETWLEHAHASS